MKTFQFYYYGLAISPKTRIIFKIMNECVLYIKVHIYNLIFYCFSIPVAKLFVVQSRIFI